MTFFLHLTFFMLLHILCFFHLQLAFVFVLHLPGFELFDILFFNLLFGSHTLGFEVAFVVHSFHGCKPLVVRFKSFFSRQALSRMLLLGIFRLHLSARSLILHFIRCPLVFIFPLADRGH